MSQMIYEKPYVYYLICSQEDRDKINFYIEYGKFEVKDYLSDIDLTDRTFLQVKLLMEAISNDDNIAFAKELDKIPDYNGDILLQKPIYQVLITLKYLTERILQLQHVEYEMLTSKVNGNDYSAQAETIDFSMFPNYYSQIRTLAHEDILKFKQIEQLPYSDCLTELIYIRKSDDLEKLILKKK